MTSRSCYEYLTGTGRLAGTWRRIEPLTTKTLLLFFSHYHRPPPPPPLTAATTAAARRRRRRRHGCLGPAFPAETEPRRAAKRRRVGVPAPNGWLVGMATGRGTVTGVQLCGRRHWTWLRLRLRLRLRLQLRLQTPVLAPAPVPDLTPASAPGSGSDTSLGSGSGSGSDSRLRLPSPLAMPDDKNHKMLLLRPLRQTGTANTHSHW